MSTLFQRMRGRALRLAKGLPVTPPALGSMTLEADDDALATRWQRQREAWFQPEVPRAYGEAFARWNGSAHAFPFMSGRVALSAILEAMDLSPGDEVVVPAYTCVVVPNAVRFGGLRPVFADIELETYGVDADALARAIGPRTRAVVLHHLYGLVARDYEATLQCARSHGLLVIEDCAQSTGARFRGVRVGNLGDAAFYSSERSKLFNTVQGGLAVTNNPELAARIARYHDRAAYASPDRTSRLLDGVRLYYRTDKRARAWWRAEAAHRRFGSRVLDSTTAEELRGVRPAEYGRKMPAPLAALGMNQLQKLDRFNRTRRETARHWDAWCARAGRRPPRVLPESEPVFLRYPVCVAPEEKARPGWTLRELRVTAGLWFEGQQHPLRARREEGFPAADEAVARCINLPCLLS